MQFGCLSTHVFILSYFLAFVCVGVCGCGCGCSFACLLFIFPLIQFVTFLLDIYFFRGSFLEGYLCCTGLG